MKIIFRKINQEDNDMNNFYHAFIARVYDSDYPMCQNIYEIYIIKLENKLREIFDFNKLSIIKIEDQYTGTIHFNIKFNNPEDEAHFLLWSSDGIEV